MSGIVFLSFIPVIYHGLVCGSVAPFEALPFFILLLLLR